MTTHTDLDEYSPEAMRALRRRMEEPPDVRAQRHSRAFLEYLRRGEEHMSRESRTLLQTEYRALSVGTNSAGGYLVPPGFARRLTTAVKRSSAMVRASNIITTASGETIGWPTADDTGNVGAIQAEGSTVSSQDVTFGQKGLGAFLYSSKEIVVSWQLLADTGIDLEGVIARMLGLRIGRGLNAHLTNGTGGGTQPNGIMNTVTTAVTQPTGNTTTYTYDSLVDMSASVDAEYIDPTEDSDPVAGFVGWMTTSAGLKALRKVKDTAGAPLLAEGRPPSILGYPIMLNPDMPVPATSARSLLFGAFGGYVTRQTEGGTQVARLSERYGDALQTGFIGWARWDGVQADTASVKALAHSAT